MFKRTSQEFFILGLILVAASAFAQGAVLPKELTDVKANLCPVTGDLTREEFAVIHEGKVFHFSCATATIEFKKKPSEYIARIKDPQEQKLRITNPEGICPITKKQCNEEIFHVRGDSITFYCCEKCPREDAPDLKPASPSTSPKAKGEPGKK